MKKKSSGARLALPLLLFSILLIAVALAVLLNGRHTGTPSMTEPSAPTPPVTEPSAPTLPVTEPPVTEPQPVPPTAAQLERLSALRQQAAGYLPAVDAPAWAALTAARTAAEEAAVSGDATVCEAAEQALCDALAAMAARIRTENGVTYVDGILIVNKTYGVPASFAPGVDATASAALEVLIRAAAADGVTMTLDNGYRPYTQQKGLYDYYVKRDGKAAADGYSARPGFSEHQSGLCFDIKEAFKIHSPQALWLAEHCWEYGFIIRYPEGKTAETGYDPEAWHIRYLGETLSRRLRELDMTLEVYLGITSVYAEP